MQILGVLNILVHIGTVIIQGIVLKELLYADRISKKRKPEEKESYPERIPEWVEEFIDKYMDK